MSSDIISTNKFKMSCKTILCDGGDGARTSLKIYLLGSFWNGTNTHLIYTDVRDSSQNCMYIYTERAWGDLEPLKKSVVPSCSPDLIVIFKEKNKSKIKITQWNCSQTVLKMLYWQNSRTANSCSKHKVCQWC